MEDNNITVRADLPWWARYYIAGCTLFAWLTGATPDVDKIVSTVIRHVRWKVVVK